MCGWHWDDFFCIPSIKNNGLIEINIFLEKFDFIVSEAESANWLLFFAALDCLRLALTHRQFGGKIMSRLEVFGRFYP